MKKILMLLILSAVFMLGACDKKTEESQFTIVFETGDNGELIEDYKYTAGTLFQLPDNPTKAGYIFDGWFYDQDFTEEFRLKDEISRDTILYANWIVGEVTVTIVKNDGSVDETITITNKGTITQPDNPTKAGYDFIGWYKDEGFTQRYNFNRPIEKDTMIYGRWEEEGNLVIGGNIYYFHDNFMEGMVKPVLEDYAFEQGVDLLLVDSMGDQGLLNQQVDTFISDGVDVLIINLVNPSSAGSIIEKAKAADIPLIFFAKEPTENGVMDTYDKVWYVGVDLSMGGDIQGNLIASDWLANPDWDLNSDGIMDYVMLKGEPGHPVAEARTRESIVAITNEGILVNELALQFSPVWSTSDANDIMETWLSGVFADDIEMIICNNDGMAFGAIQAMQYLGYDIPIYGVDALQEALQKIGEGTMSGTVLYNGEGLAKATIDLAINAALGKDVVAETDWELDASTGTKAVRVPFIAVTIDNYMDFQ